ncbi:GGDEF domain-containing protein [Aquihabitans sp. G128]|uniref:diguanylate cyclase domain-containing protein n=1 Tax=Aquihabitans sp. G128 TaxID=2849779 RepID=UPI001C22B118|nr:GGDEF domain-containing protein [Aquihabitans sp. G128]QXC60048.1 GGDEF domain-containing protein [Aquihabitans sp. G128]
MTGLPGTGPVLDALSDWLDEAMPVALLVVALTVPASADEVHRATARRLHDGLDAGALVGRRNDGLFLVVLPGTLMAARAARVGGELLEVLRQPVRLGRQERASPTVAIGIAVAEEGQAPGDLLLAADAALARAIALGPNRAALGPT